MELRLLKTFKTIVKFGSFQRAAEVLKYSQPTVTVQMKKLEEELGVVLFERGKTTKLTSAGHFFLEHAGSLIEEYEKLSSSLTDLVQGEAGIIRIGASEPTASNRLPQLMASFSLKKPKVQYQLSIGTSDDLTKKLVDWEIDMALCNQPKAHKALHFLPLLDESFVLLLPEGHPLADREQIRMRDLANESFLFTPEKCPFRIRIERKISEEIGILQKDTIEIASITAIKYYVQAKLGIALMPDRCRVTATTRNSD